MSVFAQRPRLNVPATRWIFSRGVRMPRKSMGNVADEWLKGPGLEFRSPTVGPNWLGKAHPFPLNPSFKPPPPISDKTKEAIYERYMSNPKMYNVRVLAVAYGISMKRVDAILRLKGMEKDWLKGKQLQTGFLAGMERMLNTTELAIGFVPESRRDVTDSDIQDQEEADDHARDRYQRLFWEPVADTEKPIVPIELEKAKEEAQAARQEAIDAKSDVKLLTGREPKGGPKTISREKPIVVSSGPDRPATVFRDVGGKFFDIDDRIRRLHEADRRKRAKAKARQERRSKVI
ncbi:hypothetical protein ACEPAH_854 [Sanghuangporus vaninii]